MMERKRLCPWQAMLLAGGEKCVYLRAPEFTHPVRTWPSNIPAMHAGHRGVEPRLFPVPEIALHDTVHRTLQAIR
jgi:hypothetical protein